jgi:hypothetical protein
MIRTEHQINGNVVEYQSLMPHQLIHNISPPTDGCAGDPEGSGGVGEVAAAHERGAALRAAVVAAVRVCADGAGGRCGLLPAILAQEGRGRRGQATQQAQ